MTRWLVTGAAGMLGQDLTALLAAEDGEQLIPLTRAELDITDPAAVYASVDSYQPDVVVNCAAWTAVDEAETQEQAAIQVNGTAVALLAGACADRGITLVQVSTDYVFDGTGDRPYREWDTPCPTSVYGASKLAGERECRPGSTIVRTSWLCGFHGANMVVTALRLANGEGELRFVDDQHGSPTFTADLAPTLVTLGLDRRPGIFHATNSGATTWYGFVRAILAEAGADPERVRPISTAELDPPLLAPRPAYSVLDNMALRLSGLPALPDWKDALARLVPVLRTKEAAA